MFHTDGHIKTVWIENLPKFGQFCVDKCQMKYFSLGVCCTTVVFMTVWVISKMILSQALLFESEFLNFVEKSTIFVSYFKNCIKYDAKAAKKCIFIKFLSKTFISLMF